MPVHDAEGQADGDGGIDGIAATLEHVQARLCCQGMAAGDLERAKAGLSDRMLDELAGIGSAEKVQEAVRRYQAAGAGSPGIGGLPGTDFDAAIEAVAKLI